MVEARELIVRITQVNLSDFPILKYFDFRRGEEMMIPSEMPSVSMGDNGHGNGK